VFGHGECRANWENIFVEAFNMANVHDTPVRGRTDMNFKWIKRLVLAYWC
jgi:hypothetical protein